MPSYLSILRLAFRPSLPLAILLNVLCLVVALVFGVYGFLSSPPVTEGVRYVIPRWQHGLTLAALGAAFFATYAVVEYTRFHLHLIRQARVEVSREMGKRPPDPGDD